MAFHLANRGRGNCAVLPRPSNYPLAICNIPPSRNTVPTRLPTKALATRGPYRFSRNPGYGAIAFLYTALTLTFGGWWSILALIPTILLIRYAVISREERYLERKFGEEYRAYKARVRRWI